MGHLQMQRNLDSASQGLKPQTMLNSTKFCIFPGDSPLEPPKPPCPGLIPETGLPSFFFVPRQPSKHKAPICSHSDFGSHLAVGIHRGPGTQMESLPRGRLSALSPKGKASCEGPFSPARGLRRACPGNTRGAVKEKAPWASPFVTSFLHRHSDKLCLTQGH